MVMNALMATTWVAGIIYSVFIDGRFMKIYLACLIPFLVVTQVFMKPHKENSTRKGTAISTWDRKCFFGNIKFNEIILIDPTDPTAYTQKDLCIEKAKLYLDKIK